MLGDEELGRQVDDLSEQDLEGHAQEHVLEVPQQHDRRLEYRFPPRLNVTQYINELTINLLL